MYQRTSIAPPRTPEKRHEHFFAAAARRVLIDMHLLYDKVQNSIQAQEESDSSGLHLERWRPQDLYPVSGRNGNHLHGINGLWTEPFLYRWDPRIHKVAVEAGGDAQNQEAGCRLTHNLEAVGHAAGQEDERARSRFKLLVTT